MTVLATVLALAVTASGLAAPAAADYVALGSSFAAGPGITPTQPGSPPACGRSARNYASQAAAKLRLTLTDATCSGATTADVLNNQVNAVTENTKLVTITIGGNDVNYIGSLFAYSCQTSGGSQCGTVDQAAIDRALTTVHTKIGNVVTAVRQKAPRAKVLLVNYLTVVSRTACTGVPLTQAQVDFERSVAQRLAAATRRAGAPVVDAAGASAAHDACSASPWMEKYQPGGGRAGYHPNLAGMTAVAELVVRQAR
ncbi:SGNH/GDSL hydrolase family protein [Allokutzneria multivorans]|uniref:SGNH/GDSL hydrolase family protein n=1 Tax=Allokutzneria multivorans TaxID=1142134 RepID=A0ABP7SBU6_9PSEU